MKPFLVYVIGSVILIILGLIASLVNEKSHFLLWLFEWRHPVADYYFYYVTMLGEWHGFVICGLLLWAQSWKRMVPVPVLGLTVMIVSFLLKEVFQHERPSVYLSKINWEGTIAVLGYPILGGYHSFPSGHALAGWALFTLMAAIVRKTWVSIVCLFLAVSVGLSRIYLMAHFLQDVVAGAMIGFSIGYGVYYLYVRWRKKLDQKLQS